MKYFKLKNAGIDISVISLGTWVFSGDVWGGAKEKECIDAVRTAMDSGINLIDTAPIYGYGVAERIVGKAIKGIRDNVILATKCGLLGKGANITHDLKPASIRKEIEESLSRLQTDYIDIYQCHWPDPNTPIEETLEELSRLKSAGKIKHVGVSNFEPALLKRAIALTSIVTLQSQYSLLERSVEPELLPLCQKKGVGMISYGPLAGGILTGKYKKPPQFKGADARSFFYKHYSGKNFEKVQRLLGHLKELNRPLNQIAINWVRQQQGVASVIAGCRNPEQVRQNVAATNWDLTTEELARIRNILE